MSFEAAKAYLESKGYGSRIKIFSVSSATVPLAAAAAGVEEARIAKTLSFKVDDKAVLIVAAGDRRVDNRKFKDTFHVKAKMLTHEEVDDLIGHSVGGVCPFGIRPGVRVFVDESLRNYTTVFPAAGSDNSAVELTPDELYELSSAEAWCDVCKINE